jgi:hypothetical protein
MLNLENLLKEVTQNTTHLQETTWLEYPELIEPVMDSLQCKQRDQVAKMKTIDNFLRVEMSFVDSNDVSFVLQRLHHQVLLVWLPWIRFVIMHYLGTDALQ